MPSDKVQAEADYRAFQTRIEKYISDAEAHLKLPAGTIGNTIHENDFLFVVKMCAVVEPLLKEAVREQVRRGIKPLGGSDTLLKTIGDLGLDRLRAIFLDFGAIDEMTNDFLYALFQVRNRYAHHIVNGHLSIQEICEKIAGEPNSDRRLLSKIVGAGDDPVATDKIKLIIFYQVAFFLSVAVHMAKPPAPRGILGQYFEQLANDRN
jgi:hypothetical protein